MAKIFLWAIIGLEVVLSAAAQGPDRGCRFPYVGMRSCHEHAGVYLHPNRPRYDLARLYQFCRTEDASVVSHCLRSLFTNCSFPKDLSETLDDIAGSVELGFRSLCSTIDALLDARECINGITLSVFSCFQTANPSYEERYRDQTGHLRTMIDRMRYDLSNDVQCPVALSMATCIYHAALHCGLRAASTLYNFELADNGGMCLWK